MLLRLSYLHYLHLVSDNLANYGCCHKNSPCFIEVDNTFIYTNTLPHIQMHATGRYTNYLCNVVFLLVVHWRHWRSDTHWQDKFDKRLCQHEQWNWHSTVKSLHWVRWCAKSLVNIAVAFVAKRKGNTEVLENSK